jgi:gamma-glutamyl phosphate reductase
MVRAAHSTGKPAYGVGPGNVPVYVDRSADLEKAADLSSPAKLLIAQPSAQLNNLWWPIARSQNN